MERGGYASDLLATGSGHLDSRDAGLASEIVFGVLRYRAQLDYLARHYSGREASKLDIEVLTSLRMAIYQLRHLDRIPPHAAVSESVELIRQARKRSAMGFANAVLRKVDRRPVAWPDRSVELSHPAWLLERWDRQYGADAATAIARANLRPPETYVRIPGAAPGPQFEPTDVPGCYRLGSGDAGGFRMQDIGSQTIVPLLDLHPGKTLLDMCAAPGNKTAQALEYGVDAIACDLHPDRIRMLRGLGIKLLAADGTRPLPFSRRFERILLDAPCSGTGTLARNPEIKWRLQPSDIEELHQRQVALLRQARAALAPDGLLVYSTCSLEYDENERVVETVPPHLVARRMRRIPGQQPGDGFFAAVIEFG